MPAPYRRLAAALAIALAIALTAPALAGGGPDTLFLVVNEDSWASQTVANTYVWLRSIPPGNVFYLRGLPAFHTTGVEAFRETILKPTLRAIDARGLKGRIDTIVYSSDLPWGIDVRGDVGQKQLPRIITKRASINGLTYLYELVLDKDIEYLNLASNWYYRRPLPRAQAAPWTDAEKASLQTAQALILDKKWAEAETAFRALAKARPATPQVHYNLACCLAHLARPDDAMAALTRAVRAGWANAAHTRQDADLASLRDRDDFTRLLQAMKQPLFDVQPTTAFRSADAWSRQGNLTEPRLGRRYMLSTMLAVTSGRGNSVDEVRSYLGRSAAADGTAPAGAVYLLTNSNVRSTTREWAFRTTVETLKARGLRAEILSGVLPKDKPDVAGCVVGAAAFNWKACGSTILPGAICEHLTSSGGVMSAGAGQTPLSEFLRYGAAASSGTVTEPMAIQAKFPSALLHVHYAAGASLAEAFYQSIFGPYQLLIVGDPLCRPWATIPEVTVEGVRPGQTVKGTLHLRPGTRNLKPDAVDHYELLLWGLPHERCGPGETIEIDTTTFSDGYYALRLVAVASNAVRTRGFLEIPVTVRNKGVALAVTAPEHKQVTWGEPLRLSAALPGARAIRFMHNARTLATIEGERGEAEIDTRRLGLGPVRILPVAHLPPQAKVKPSDFAKASRHAALSGDSVMVGRQIVAAPVAVDVVAPPPLPPPADVPPANERVTGLSLSIAGGDPIRIQDSRRGDWLAKAGLKKGQAFTLEGYTVATEDGLFQFQVRTGGEVRIVVSGQTLDPIEPGRWVFLPVHLARGTHRVRVTGTFAGRPQLDLHVGLRGTRPIGSDAFTCTGPFPEAKPAADTADGKKAPGTP